MQKSSLLNLRSGKTGLYLGNLTRQEVFWLVAPNEHIMLLDARRAVMILSRLKLVAALFALLTPLWAVLDYLAFPAGLWSALLAGRAVATAAFIALLVFFRNARQMSDAQRALILLFAIPTLFYLYSAICFEQYHVTGFPKALETTHSFLPFLVVAGLSIFPLTALEALVLAIPVLVAKGGASMLTWPPSNWPQLIGTFWLVLLLTSVAMLASVSQLAFIIALVRQAIRDPLTGCFSRQSGVELLELQYSLAERSGAPLAVAFLDIDHFKQVNDEYGHEVGDMVLVTAAHQISTHLRTGDILVRWGGEEFLIIMPNSGVERALVGLERLQAATLGMRPELAPLTASVGLAERIADRATDWQTLVSLSDARMYQAKENGRNRIVSCDLPIQDESFHPQ
jgi:diguanylate cyclase (GGDEF)-like protein